MGIRGSNWSKLYKKDTVGLWTPLFALFSILYGAGVRLRLHMFYKGFFKKKSLPGFVVSIGNLTTGGTGKTPAVIMLARWALKEGYRVAVLSRGYGGRYKARVLVVSDGNHIKADPRETGDEPYLIAKRLLGVPVLISKKRFPAGLYAHRKFGCNFFVLDDGFQHLELKRDLNLVLIDAVNPFGNCHLLPWGPLREPVMQMSRADASIVTRVSRHGSGENVLNTLKARFPAIPVFFADHIPSSVVFPHLNEVHDPGLLMGKRVAAFAGIAQPEAFKDTLTGLGADVVYFRGFMDHYQFKGGEIRALIQMKKQSGGQYLITTEKDWMRITSLGTSHPDFAYLSIEFTLMSGQDDFFKILKNGINRKKIHFDNHI